MTDLVCPWIINCGLPHCSLPSHNEFITSAMDYQHWLTVDYLAVVCFPLMDSLSDMDYQLWIILPLLTAVCFPTMNLYPQSWIMNIDQLCIPSLQCFPLMDSLSAIIIINCGLPHYGVLSPDEFTVSNGLSAVRDLCCGSTAVVLCSRIICCLLH